MIGNLSVYVLGRTMNISVCLPRNHIQRFPDIFVDFRFMNKAILANQCMFVCTPYLCPSVYVQGSGLVSTVWKVSRLRGKNSWMQIPPESCRSILMFHWIRALKPLQYHWVFYACSLNGLCKVVNCELNFPCTLIFSLSHLRQDIGDDPPILASGRFLMEAISAPFICQSVWSESLQRWLNVRL